jgi:hypothetical protein
MKEPNIKTVTLDHLRCSKPRKIFFNTIRQYDTSDGIVKERYNSLTRSTQYTLKGRPVSVKFYDEPEQKHLFFTDMHDFLDFLT